MPIYVVVSGLPASGKTTIAQALARKLDVEHLDKDSFLETLFDREQVIGPDRRHALSRLADEHFQAAALACNFAVLSSWWRHPHSENESGTPTGWLQTSGSTIIEIYCQCSTQEALQRFLARQRHAGHLDDLRGREGLAKQFEAAAALGPLFQQQALLCNTSNRAYTPTLEVLATQVRQLTGSSSAA